MSSTITIPPSKSITPLIISSLPSNLTQQEISVIENITENLANEYITVNEIYNLVINALPPINSFLNEIAITNTLKQTFTTYTSIWIPFQFAVIIGIFIIIILTLTIMGYIRIDVAFVLIISGSFFVAAIGILELDTLVDYLSSSETDFINKFTTAFNKFKSDILLSGALGYVSGSQLTVNGPTGPNFVPGFGPIILNEPGKLFKLQPAYYKVTLFRTESPTGADMPIYPVILQENTVNQGPIVINTIKPQYGKIIYIVNSNRINFSPSPPTPADTGIIKIINATKTYPPDKSLFNGFEIPWSSWEPPYEGGYTGGVFIYPGECRCFVNAGYNQNLNLIPPHNSNTGTAAVTTWIELTSIARPNSSVFNSNSMTSFPKPTSVVTFLQIPNTATADLTTSFSTEYASPGDEWYLYSAPGSTGPTTTTSINGGTFAYQYNTADAYVNVKLHSGIVKVLKGQFVCLIFDEVLLRWVTMYNPDAV